MPGHTVTASRFDSDLFCTGRSFADVHCTHPAPLMRTWHNASIVLPLDPVYPPPPPFFCSAATSSSSVSATLCCVTAHTPRSWPSPSWRSCRKSSGTSSAMRSAPRPAPTRLSSSVCVSVAHTDTFPQFHCVLLVGAEARCFAIVCAAITRSGLIWSANVYRGF